VDTLHANVLSHELDCCLAIVHVVTATLQGLCQLELTPQEFDVEHLIVYYEDAHQISMVVGYRAESNL